MRLLSRWLPWLAVILSGTAALAHEMLWTRRLIDLLGATHEASARVIACFFLGLSLGAAVTPALLRRTKNPWKIAALIEIGIALLCLPIFFLPDFYTQIWQQLGPEQLGTPKARAMKLVISALLIVPPAFLMGTTLPLMVAGLLKTDRKLERHGIWLYALNTAGGVAGILLATHVALGQFGVQKSMLVAIALNLATAAVCFVLHLVRSSDTSKPNDNESDRESSGDTSASGQSKNSVEPNSTGPIKEPIAWGPLGIAFVSGFGVLGFEVLCLHLFSHVVTNLNATTTVLATFIFILFISAAIVPLLVPRQQSTVPAMAWALSLTAVFIALTPIIFMVVTGNLSKVYEGYPTVTAHFLSVAWLVFASAGIAVLMSGMVFPLAVMLIGQRSKAAEVRWGSLLAVNGLGGAIGAEFANNVLMPQTGLYLGFGALAVGYAVLGVWFARRLVAASSGLAKAGAVFGLLISATITAVFLPKLPVANAKLQPKTVGMVPGPDGVIAVIERSFELPTGTRVSRSMLWNSQYTLGGSLSKPYERRQVLIPLMMHPAPRRVASLGLATGISAGAALDVPQVESLVAVELSAQVVDAAKEYFSLHNRKIGQSPRAEIVVEDARTYVDACEDEFDVIVGEFFRPHATGEGRLFTVEHFRSVRNALRDGGHFCQWIPCYQINEAEFEVILASFLDVFPEADVWRVNLKTQYNAYGLVGYKNGSADFDGLESRCAAAREAKSIFDPPCRHAEGIMMHYVGRLDTDDITTSQRNTLDNLWLELVGGKRDATNNAFNSSLVNKNFKNFDEALRDRVSLEPAGSLAQWTGLGNKFLAWNYSASLREPESLQMLSDAKAAIPAKIMDDKSADWSYWPED